MKKHILFSIWLIVIGSPQLSAMSLETPQMNSTQSGIGLIRGWVCDAQIIEAVIDNDVDNRTLVVYGNERGDTLNACGDTNNGFELLINWGIFSDGQHTLQMLADSVEFANITFSVASLGLGSFVTGLTGDFILDNFPSAGQSTVASWSESDQNFIIKGIQATNPLVGIWQNNSQVLNVFANGLYSFFSADDGGEGEHGTYQLNGNNIISTVKFSLSDPIDVGMSFSSSYTLIGNTLTITDIDGSETYTKVNP